MVYAGGMEHTEVAVVGGGVAGLAALQALRAAGCEAVLLEARARLGGRIWTVQPEGWPLPVELGAEFIHGAPPELRALAAAGDEAAGADWSWSEGELRPTGEFGNGAWELLDRMGDVRPPAPDRSFAAFLNECGDAPEAARVSAIGYIEGFEAADPGRISVYSLNRERAAEGEEEGPWPLRPRGGYGPWVASLASDGGVWLDTQVHTITWRPGAVTLAARRAGAEMQLQARRAIIALPLSLLQQSRQGAPPAVKFEPRLEAKRAALDGLVMGGALRVTLRLREAFWQTLRDAEGRRLEGLRFLFGPPAATGHFSTWWTAPGAPQITGWAAGRHAWALAGRVPELLQQRALADLGERLGVPPGAIEPLVLAAHLHDWQTDAFSLGGYSYAAVGGADAFAALAAPLEHTLYFAGEATDDTGQHATVQGALRSGQRAAREALAGI